MPSVSDKQQRFMGAELARKRKGKKTRTRMSEKQLKEYATKAEAGYVSDSAEKIAQGLAPMLRAGYGTEPGDELPPEDNSLGQRWRNLKAGFKLGPATLATELVKDPMAHSLKALAAAKQQAQERHPQGVAKELSKLVAPSLAHNMDVIFRGKPKRKPREPNDSSHSG